jgi:hypothetical protein
MATATKTRAPKPKAPTKPRPPQVPANPPEHDEDHPVTSEVPSAPAPRAPRVGNPAQASAEYRAQVTARMAELRADGWTRPAISALTGFSDSQVWRAQNDKVHTAELDTWATFFAEVREGKHRPPTSGRKLKVDELQARVREALDVLGNEARTTAQYRKLVEAAQEILGELVPQSEVTEAGDDVATEAGANDTAAEVESA